MKDFSDSVDLQMFPGNFMFLCVCVYVHTCVYLKVQWWGTWEQLVGNMPQIFPNVLFLNFTVDILPDRQRDRQRIYLFFHMQVCIFVCVYEHLWLCVANLKALWDCGKTRLETDIIRRILSLGCPQRRISQVCGWWRKRDRWDAACCFPTTWNAIC